MPNYISKALFKIELWLPTSKPTINGTSLVSYSYYHTEAQAEWIYYNINITRKYAE